MLELSTACMRLPEGKGKRKITKLNQLMPERAWRFASNEEVEDLFGQLFVGYYDTYSGGYSRNTAGAYANQSADVNAFEALFGPGCICGSQTWNMGLYKDEDEIVRVMGSLDYGPYNDVHRLEYYADYSAFYDSSGNSGIGT
jgi:hypothetical protein